MMYAVKRFETGFAVPNIWLELVISKAKLFKWWAKYLGIAVSMVLP